MDPPLLSCRSTPPASLLLHWCKHVLRALLRNSIPEPVVRLLWDIEGLLGSRCDKKCCEKRKRNAIVTALIPMYKIEAISPSTVGMEGDTAINNYRSTACFQREAEMQARRINQEEYALEMRDASREEYGRKIGDIKNERHHHERI